MGTAALNRKDAIVSTAIDIIDEFGIQGLSTKEVAKRQGVSEGTIFKHFKTKNGLVLGILDQFSMFDSEIALTISMKGMEPVEALYFYVNAFAEYYDNYPQMIAIAEAYDALAYDSELSQVLKNILANRWACISDLAEKAKETGSIIPDANSDDLADVISGLFRAICLRWKIGNRSFSLKERITRALKMILDALKMK